MGRSLNSVMQLISSLEVGGTETLLVEFLTACRDDDAVNFVVVVMNNQVNEGLREALERLSIPVYFLDRPAGHAHPKYLWQLLRIMRDHHVNIVHAHNQGSKMWGALCKLLNPGVRLVFTIHDTMMMPKLDALQVWIHRRVIDMNIAISKAVEAGCAQRGIGNVRQIYNGIPLQKFANARGAQADGHSLVQRMEPGWSEDNPLRLLHVGRMDAPVKGQDILLQALKICRAQGLHVQARLMGGVYHYNEDAFAGLQRQVDEYGLTGSVEFLVNRSDVPEVLADADLFVLPSRKEGLGLVLLEAMAAGVPVIASDIDGPRELVEDGVTGTLFECGNPDDLFRKIRMAYRMPAVADRLREQASAYVTQFDVHHMKKQYFRLYHDVMQTGGPEESVQPAAKFEEIWE